MLFDAMCKFYVFRLKETKMRYKESTLIVSQNVYHNDNWYCFRQPYASLGYKKHIIIIAPDYQCLGSLPGILLVHSSFWNVFLKHIQTNTTQICVWCLNPQSRQGFGKD